MQETQEGGPPSPGLEALDRFVSRRELAALRPVLQPGEEVRHVLDGLRAGRRGILAATDRRVLHLTKTLLGRRVLAWDYEEVSGVAVQKAVDDATVTLAAPEGPFILTGCRKAAAAAFQEAVRLALPHRTFRRVLFVGDPRNADPGPEGSTTAERLRRLERMRALRTITEPEYRVNRRRILEQAGLPTDLRRRTV